MSFIAANPPAVAGVGGIGDVVGPGSSTDNAIARFDGTTGKLIQNSGIILDDSNNLTGINSITVTTIVATATVTTGDNIIRLNDDVVGAPTEDAGIEVERGAGTDATLLWDETNDYWVAGLVGSTSPLLRISGLTNSSNISFITLGDQASPDLTNTTVSAGSYGSATQVGTFTVDGKGRLTAASNTSIQIAESQVTNLVSDLAGKQATGNYITALTGDVTASGPGSVAATLANTAVTPGSYGSTTQVANFTVDSKGRLTAAAQGTITAAAISDLPTASLEALGVDIQTGTTTGTGFSTISTYALSDNTAYNIHAAIIGRRTTVGKYAEYSMVGCFYRAGGGATQLSTTTNISSSESDGTYAARFAVSGNNVIVEAHGDAGSAETVNWKTRLTITSVA